MSCNKNKNCHYKSSVQFFNNAVQPILVTNIVSNPINVSLGNKITDTGVAIDFSSSGVDIQNGGLYRISADTILIGGTAGSITIAMTVNGNVLPETVKEVTVGTATDTIEVSTETVRAFNTCCTLSDYVVGIIAYSDGTGIGSVSSISGNVIKLA